MFSGKRDVQKSQTNYSIGGAVEFLIKTLKVMRTKYHHFMPFVYFSPSISSIFNGQHRIFSHYSGFFARYIFRSIFAVTQRYMISCWVLVQRIKLPKYPTNAVTTAKKRRQVQVFHIEKRHGLTIQAVASLASWPFFYINIWSMH